MPELTREEKLKMIEKLPQQLQDFLYSEDTGAALLYLGKKYDLPDEKVRLLSKLVGDIVLGIVPITSLAQEINSKVTASPQAAMNLAQELYTELLAPVMTVVKSMPTPQTLQPPTPQTDQYREPTTLPSQVSPREIWEGKAPEIVDLRKTPPIGREGGLPPRLPVAPSPIPSVVSRVEPPRPPMPTPRPAPLIEADPHRTPVLTPTLRPLEKADTYREPVGPPVVSKVEPPPQYIMRPSGLPPTDLPHDVLDLRRDKGEF